MLIALTGHRAEPGAAPQTDVEAGADTDTDTGSGSGDDADGPYAEAGSPS
ncbi:hypothetical protein ABT224_32800 [Streptomyces sp. NPDC001584]